jgi:hypothetical protein
MRQRPLVIFKPNTITHVDKTAAQRAAFEMFGLAQWWSADLPPDHGAARARFVDIHDDGHQIAPFQKANQVQIALDPILIRRAVYIRPCGRRG